MKFAVIRMNIVHIICSNKSDIVFFCKLTQSTVDGLFLGQTVILNLQKKIILPKDLHILCNQSLCPLVVPAQDCLWNLPCHTCRERNNPLMVLTKKFFVNTRLIIISLDICEGY